MFDNVQRPQVECIEPQSSSLLHGRDGSLAGTEILGLTCSSEPVRTLVIRRYAVSDYGPCQLDTCNDVFHSELISLCL